LAITRASLQIFADGLELLYRPASFARIGAHSMIQAVVDVVMHQSFLGLRDSFLDCMELLSDLKARSTLLNHGDHGSKMALNPFETLHNFGMAVMYLGSIAH
jgi:hypothetical protein